MAVIRRGLEIADKVLVIFGSANSPPSHSNPFNVHQRYVMLSQSFTEIEAPNVLYASVEDSAYNDVKWVFNIQRTVDEVVDLKLPKKLKNTKITLIGHSKDSSSYYLKMFPQWDSVEVENFGNFNSTVMRNVYFSNAASMWLKDCDGHKDGDLKQDAQVTSQVRDYLEKFLTTEQYKNIKGEYEFILSYKASWSNAPYPPIFVTTDACVIQSGHILLIRRAARPGKGLWALPGGFINQDETVENCMIRELREETGIKVPDKVLRGNITKREVFDDPNRSSRGRTITHGFLINLPAETTLPKIKGSDDADKAAWVPLYKINRSDFYDDHYDMILKLTSGV
jgi:bifunctional NMN adenylyltransferase/nudix hydrolase